MDDASARIDQLVILTQIDQPVHQASPHARKTIYTREGDDRIYVLLPLCKARVKSTGMYCTRSVSDETQSFCRAHTSTPAPNTNQ